MAFPHLKGILTLLEKTSKGNKLFFKKKESKVAHFTIFFSLHVHHVQPF